MRAVSSIVLCLALAASAAGQPLLLEWKLQPGDTFRIESVERQLQKVTTAGKTSELRNAITTLVGAKVRKAMAEQAVVDLQIESVDVDAKEGDMDASLARLMSGAAFTLTVTPRGRITGFEGYEAFIKKLSKDRPGSEKLLRSLIAEEGLRKTLGDYFAFLPDRAVVRGANWEIGSVIPLGPLGSFRALNKYVYEGERGGVAEIAYIAKLAYEQPREGSDIFRVVKGNLQAKSASGSFQFEVARGRLLRAEKRLTLDGNMTIEVAGKQVEMRLEMEQTTTVRIIQ